MPSFDSLYADDDSPYIFKPNKLSLSKLVKEHLPLPEKYIRDSVPLLSTGTPGFSEIYRNAAFQKGLKEAISPELDTYYKLFQNAVNTNGEKPCLASRKYDYVSRKSEETYSSISFNEVNEMKTHYGSGFLYLLQNNPYKNAEKFESHRKIDNHIRDYKLYNRKDMSFVISLYSGNRMEWVLTDLMATAFSITNTALYDTLGPEASEYILESTQSPVVIASKNHIAEIIKLKETNPEKLEHVIAIISMDPLDFQNDTPFGLEDIGLQSMANSHKITLFDINQLNKIGKIFPIADLSPSPETVYTISFTSGTTGSKPKGVILTQKIATAGITFVFSQIPQVQDGKVFAFLPLAHIFERQTCAFSLCYGACVGFPQLNGTPLTLVEDLRLFKPNHMSNVPRVFTKYEAAIKNATVDNSESALKRNVFGKVLDKKVALQELYDGSEGFHAIYDRLFLNTIRKTFGFDKMKYVITGSAPISVSTVKFLKAALNIGMLQGYGLTESFAGFAISIPYEATPGSCGATGVTTEMRLRELPEMGYRLTDADGPRGELLLRGPQIFKEYFKNPEETEKSIDKDGWFYTGDVARFSKDHGRLFIIDRVKNFFKLAQGEYVTPEKVENKYLSSSSLLNQLFVHGNSTKNFLVGIIGIDPASGPQFLTDKCKVPESSLSSPERILEEFNKKENKDILLKYMNSRVDGLQGFEKLRNVYVEFEPLRVDRNVVTPTMKIKRPIAAKFFEKQILDMYEEGSLTSGSKF